MDIKIAPNKLNNHESVLHVNENQHVYTLIGENGCGKSSILETIFKDYENISGDGFLVAYSSGKNERFSRFYKKGIRTIKNQELKFIENRENDDEGLILDNRNRWFYFDKTWAQILIFLATMLKKNGRVRNFLTSKNYIINDNEQDKTSTLCFRIKITSRTRKFIKRLREKAELDISINQSTQWMAYLMLENMINNLDPDYDFETNFRSNVKINNENFYDILKKDIAQNIDFFYQYGVIKNAISVSTLSLKFDNDIFLEDLSDGEFQILTVFSILDLFDGNDTIFLLDEIDSHLYYKRIKELRESLYQIKGIVITTTHIPDSILGNKIDSLCLVEKGDINGDATTQEIINRMSSLTDHNEYEKKMLAQRKYIALVEDQTDWFIFTELLKKFIGKEKVEGFKKAITIIKYPSGIDSSSEIFGGGKKSWITDFINYTQLDGIKTKGIFCICDRDVLNINDISECKVKGKIGNEFRDWIKNHLNLSSRLKKTGGNFINNNVFLLSWKRKQIENYLLSYTMLKKYNKLKAINNKLGMEYKFKKGKTGDNEQVQNLEIKNIIKLLYSGEGTGVDYKKLQEIIDDIPKNEVSDDIMYMYNFINSKLDKCDQQ